MNRRELLTSIGLLSLSGCTTRLSDTATPSATEPVECPEPSRPEPSPDPAVDPKEYPDFPDELSDESVRNYCYPFERAYIWNWILSKSHDVVNITVKFPRAPSVQPVDGATRFESYVRVMYASESPSVDGRVQGDMKYDVTYEVGRGGTRRKSDRGRDTTFSVVDCP